MEEFKPFLPIKENEIAELWKKAIFVFDANVLLNLYRYTEKTSSDLLDILDKMEKQIWIPHQVALEYHFNRRSVIINQKKSYGKIKDVFQQQFSTLKKGVNENLSDYIKSHPRLNIKELIEQIEKVDKEISSVIDKNESSHPGNLINDDPYLDKVMELFLHRTGINEYDQKQLDEIYNAGKERYEREIPPGYKDMIEKKGELKFWGGLRYESEYGDLIVWNQMIDKAKKEKKPIVFITEDTKDDWWQKEKGLTLGPRIELIEEFQRKTSQNFYMYRVFRFMEFVKENRNSNVSPESISEARELRMINTIESLNDFKEQKLRNNTIPVNSQKQEETYVISVKAIALREITTTNIMDFILNSELEDSIQSLGFNNINHKGSFEVDEKFEIYITVNSLPVNHPRTVLNKGNYMFYAAQATVKNMTGF